jgi:uncharacterized protein YqgC (DUF456 family)
MGLCFFLIFVHINFSTKKFMDVILIVLSGLLILIGFLGCILPVLPGVPLSYIGILLLHFSSKVEFSVSFLVIWGIIVLVAQLFDYIFPLWGAKKFGGSKKGIWGSTVGMMIGLFFAPWGIILGPFVGAIIGELVDGKNQSDAIRAGFGTFVGMLVNMVSKLIIAGFFIFYYVEALLKMI